ncbi:potassium channel family protein [Streptomyces sp. CA-210063]|uniref:potassium channel family protein n=1 Tax=Streptomyces sp. CA-210063 TaxID=2801029 RepID=UPI00214CB252|nr:potassium channel family protein [Streptomyces sp. CA-210063]UUU33789.1 potassium channel family protein [Streptomyces sp. CA-210063]
MSDPSTARTDRARSGPDARRTRRRRRPHRWAAAVAGVRAVLIAVGLVTAYYLLPLDERGTAGASTLLVCGLVAVGLVFSWEVRVIARSPHPRLKAVEALAATLVLFLVLFAGAYYLLDRSAPGSFSEPLTRTDALYFALTTFSTVGYGDIAARSQAGRVLTMLQMTGGLLLVGVAARVLAGAVQAGLRRQRRGPSGQRGSGSDAGTPDREDGP